MDGDIGIFHYTDYRMLLRDFYSAKDQRMKRRYSYRAFAKEAGFSSPNYICLIIQGKKNIAEAGIHGLAQAMKLSKRERDFFESLVYFNQATSTSKRDYYFKKICAFKEFAVGHRLLTEEYDYFSKWYNVAIREMISLPEFRYDSDWIAGKLTPKISAKEAREALDLLWSLKLVTRNADGRLVLADQHLCTDDEVSSLIVLNFHREMVMRALDALEHAGKDRDFSASTMAVSREQFDEIKRRAAEFRKEIQAYIAEHSQTSAQTPDRICQLNVQFFHLTETHKGQGNVDSQ